MKAAVPHAFSPGAATMSLQSLINLRKRKATHAADYNDELRPPSMRTPQKISNLSPAGCNPYAESLVRSIKAQADTYARDWNVGCAHNILYYRHMDSKGEGLHLELRNIVYKELISLHKLAPGIDHGSKRGIRHSKPHTTWGTTSFPLITAADYPHYFHQAFMGFEFVKELSQMFYLHQTFRLKHPKELDYLLFHDRFETDYVPSTNLTHIKIFLALGKFTTKFGKQYGWKSTGCNDLIKTRMEGVTKGLRKLKYLKHQHRTAKLTLKIDCRSPEHEAPMWAESLVHIIYDLKSWGWTVEIKGIYSSKNRDQEYFNFDVPRDWWNNKIRTNSAFVCFNHQQHL
ncbi:hypothetical protein GQ44DRAFT_774630 [Phaeosphaeriaceae sp. PMI808]|nr:hypothetical protein GQ44DRAFT_774630 [Phaeosphaeriaceae sp. PMI808]